MALSLIRKCLNDPVVVFAEAKKSPVFINNPSHYSVHRFYPKKGKTLTVLKSIFKNSSGSISHCPIPEIKGVYV